MKTKKAIFKILIISLLAFFLMGATSCQTKTDRVISPEGPIASALGKTKDEQIKGLYERVLAEMQARELEQKRASLAAANFDSILFAAGYVDIGLPRNAIEEEAKLGKERSPTPNPEEIIKGKDRVIAILQNDVAKAKELYGKAFDEAKQAKTEIEQKNKEIQKRDEEIEKRNQKIDQLEKDKVVEAEKHKKDVEEAIARKDAEIKKIKDDMASKERATWVLWTRIAGLGFIIIGAVIAIVFKIIPEGASFVGVGVLIGLVSIFIDWLTNQPWFPWLCGGIILTIFAAGGYALYRMWVKHQLGDKKTQAIQDMIDEATVKGDITKVEELKAHLEYRMGKKTDFWGKQQLKEVEKLGLVNPRGEEMLKKENAARNL